MSVTDKCTPECEASPECQVCHLRKPPRGRSVPLEMTNGMCGADCDGYYKPPMAGHLWPGEFRSERERTEATE